MKGLNDEIELIRAVSGKLPKDLLLTPSEGFMFAMLLSHSLGEEARTERLVERCELVLAMQADIARSLRVLADASVRYGKKE